jgi:hypothetical protein
MQCFAGGQSHAHPIPHDRTHGSHLHDLHQPSYSSICSCPRSRRHFRLRGRRPRSACYHLRLHAETSGHKMDLYTSCRCRPAVQGTHKLPTPTPMPTLAVIHASAPSRPAMNLCTNADVDAPPRGRTRYTR